MIDLAPEQLAIVRRLLAAQVPECEIRAFGSRVAWTAKAHSDLDLALVGPERIASSKLRRLRESFEESGLSVRVDLLDWHAITENFQRVIASRYEVLQKAAKVNPGRAQWKILPLGELTENLDGRRVPVKELDRKPGPYPYYGASGIVDRVDGYLFDGEYLLIGEDGENLRTRQTPIAFMATGKFWVNNHAHIVRGNHRADTRFLSYVLSQTDISGYLTGSTMPKLTQGNLNRLPVIVPPLAEQKAIAAVLGALDDKIECNRRMNATLEAMARALFQSWFVDFDPVRAKLDGRQPFPEAEVRKNLTQRRKDAKEGSDAETLCAFAPLREPSSALFPAAFQDSEAGHIPKGWNVGKVSDLATLNRGAVNPGDFPTETFDHFSLPAFDNGRTPKVELGSAIMSNKLTVTPNSVLLSKLNPHIPRIWLPDLHPSRRSVCSTEFMVACSKPGVSREYLFSLFTSSAFANIYGTLVTGTTGSHQRIRPESVLDMKIVIPSAQLIRAFTDIAKPMFDRINRNTGQSRTLATLRDTLLPKLLSGALSVAEQPLSGT